MSKFLDRFRYFKQKGETFADGHGQLLNTNRDWEDGYRQRWQHDKIVRSTHGVNCTGSCSWKIYVKNGLVTWETQQTDYPRTRPDLPNHEPRGCPRGASYSWYLYSANRLKYPEGGQWALEELVRAAVENAAEEAGYTFTDEDQATVDNSIAYMKSYAAQLGASSFEGYLRSTYGKYMTVGAYEDCVRRDVLVSSYKNAYMDGLDITDDAIQTYYDEHKNDLDSFTFRSIQIDGTAPSGTDGEGNTVEPTEEESAAAMQAAKAKADEFAAAVEAAEDKEATFAELAPNYVSESSKEKYESDPDYSLTTALSGTSVSSRTYGEWMLDASRTTGDVGVVEYDTGYYVVLFQERYLDETPTADIRHILIKAELTQEDDPATEDVDESTVPTQEALDAAQETKQQLNLNI